METHQVLITFAVASVLGVSLLTLANKLRVSSIVLLLIGGIVAGPQFLDWVDPSRLGGGLNHIISMAVGLILFEGGLSLDFKGYRSVSREIISILTKGVVVTWVLSALMLWLLFPLSLAFCVLSASLIIVTGPTVIGPLLNRIRVKKNLHHILHWEGVLIDPLGVFIALLCYEWMLSSETQEAYFNFFYRFFVGAAMGLLFGYLLYLILKTEWIPEERLNTFVLASALFIFSIADYFVSESGLLSVTIAGLLLGYKNLPKLGRVIEYKVELKDYLIGLLFILLAANLDLQAFVAYGDKLIWIVAFVMFVVRPLNIWISLWNSTLVVKEKLFLCWIAPRGIVAASMASLFALHLGELGYVQASFLETFTYSVIAGTVLFQGFTAGLVGSLLGVLEPKPQGWLIVGSHVVGRAVAKFIREKGGTATIIDTNARQVKVARRESLPALVGNAITADPEHQVELYGTGNVLSITKNEELNRLVCQHWKKTSPESQLYFWTPEAITETKANKELIAGKPIWPKLNLKAILPHEEETQTLRIRQFSTTARSVDDPDRVLMYHYKGRFLPVLPPGAEGPVTILTISMPEKMLTVHTDKDWFFLSNEETLEVLYSRMLERLALTYPGIDKQELLQELVRREEEFSSLIGNGISLPHTYVPDLAETLLLVAKLSPALPCRHTGADISLIFLLISPTDRPVEHLDKISEIAKFTVNPVNRAAMLAATNVDELYEVVASAGTRLPAKPA